jgi:hypothetical protein
MMPETPEAAAAAATPEVSSAEIPMSEFETGGVAASPAAASDATPPTPAASPAAPAAAEQTIAEWNTIRDVVSRGLGYQFGENAPADDYAALQHLVSQAREADSLRQRMQHQDFFARLGQQIVPHAAQFNQYMQQQASAPAQRPAYEPPPFDQNWMHLVQRDDATGVYVSRPGVDPSIAGKVNDYQQWIQGFAQNPLTVINSAADARAEAKFNAMFAERMAEQERVQSSREILSRNASWLYQADPTGQIVYGANGQPALTPAGARYSQIMTDLARNGVSDVRMRDQYARSILYAEHQYTQANAGAAAARANPAQTAAANTARTQVNPLQALSGPDRRANPGATEPSVDGLSFREQLQNAFAAEGVNGDLTPEDFFPSR